MIPVQNNNNLNIFKLLNNIDIIKKYKNIPPKIITSKEKKYHKNQTFALTIYQTPYIYN